MNTIKIDDFTPRIHDLWKNRWFLLTSGDYDAGQFNTMTVAWGFFGVMWNRPMAVVVVRPGRFTYEFIEKYETFTLTAFPKEYKKDLLLLGTKSGRDGNKINETKLIPCASMHIAAPSFSEAELSIECRKAYFHDFDPNQFIDKTIDKNYPLKDYHRVYYGEVLGITGLDKYSSQLFPD